MFVRSSVLKPTALAILLAIAAFNSPPAAESSPLKRAVMPKTVIESIPDNADADKIVFKLQEGC